MGKCLYIIQPQGKKEKNMEKSVLRLIAMLLTLMLIFSCTACKKSNDEDSSDYGSTVEIIEYENDDGDESAASGSNSTASGGGTVKKNKDGSLKVTLDTKNIAGDSEAQKALQAQLKNSAKGKTLTILSTWGEDGLVNQSWKAMFKAICGGDLKIIRCADWSGMQQKLASMHVAGNAPDLYEMTNQDYPSIVYRDILLPLNDHIDFNSAVYTNLDKELLSQLTFNGKVYFWPTFTDATGYRKGLWVNLSLLEQRGVPANMMPDALIKANNWTWDTLYEVEKKVTDKTNGIYGFVAPDNSCLAAGVLVTTGEDFIKYTKDGIMSNFQSNNVTRAMNMYKKLADPSYFTNDKAVDIFDNGKAGFIYGSADQVSAKKRNATAKAGTVKIVPFPRDPKQSQYIVLGDITGIAVPSGSKNKETAINFVKMLRASDYYNKQVGDIYYKQYSYTDQAKQYSDDCIKKYKMMVETSMGIKDILGICWKAYSKEFVEGSASWETRAAEYSPQIQSLLDKMG